jgi:hypothetical protein
MEDKYAAQTTLPENIRGLYQQILSQGTIGESLTLQIVQDVFPDREPDIQPEISREIDIEPERQDK